MKTRRDTSRSVRIIIGHALLTTSEVRVATPYAPISQADEYITDTLDLANMDWHEKRWSADETARWWEDSTTLDARALS